MLRSTNRQRLAQLVLFHPTQSGPTWEQLPPEIRQQTVRLLGRLMRERMAKRRAGKLRKEPADE